MKTIAIAILATVLTSTAALVDHPIDGDIRRQMQLSARRHEETFRQIHGRDRRRVDALHRDEGELWRLKGYEHFRGCPGVLLRFRLFELDGSWYAATISNAAGDNTHIYRFSLEEGCGELMVTLANQRASNFAIVRVDSGLRMAVVGDPPARAHQRGGSRVYNLISDGSRLNAVEAEVLLSEHPTCVTTWMQFGVPHLAICSGRSDDSAGRPTYSAKSNIFCASGGYYDKCGELATHNARQIAHFRVRREHFLAVANHPNDTAAEHAAAEVFKYSFAAGAYVSFQHLPTKAAVDVCALTLGSGSNQQHFLAVVNHHTFDSTGEIDYSVKSHIYKFVDDKFEPFQTIPTYKATSCLTHQVRPDQLVLMFADASGAISYQYDGWRFAEANVYTQHAMGPGLVDLETARIGGETYITASNKNPDLAESSNLFLARFESHTTLSSLYDGALSTCSATRQRLEANPLAVLVDRRAAAAKKQDTDLHLGRVNFTRISADRVLVDELNIKSERLKVGLPIVHQLQNIQSSVLDLMTRLKNLQTLEKMAIRTEGDYVINGPVTVDSLRSSCRGGCAVRDVTAVAVNDEDVELLYEETLYLDDPHIATTLHFQSLVVDGAVDTPLLSDVDVTDYVDTGRAVVFDRPVRVTGTVTFADQLSVTGTVNDKFIDSQLLLKDGDQTFDWQLDVQGIRTPRLNATLVNGYDFDHFRRRGLTTGSDFTLIRPRFETQLAAANLTVTGLVNGVDIVDIFNSSMKVQGDQTVTGSHRYSDVIMGNVTVAGLINGQELPSDRFISIRDSDEVRFGLARLERGANFTSLNVTRDFAGLLVDVDGRIDSNLLLQSRNDTQVITGRKVFAAIRSIGNVTSDSVNNGTVPLFDTDVSLHGSPDTLITYDQLVIPGEALFTEPLVAESIRDVDLTRLLEKGVPLSAATLPAYDSITFNGDLVLAGDLAAETIDGMPARDFVSAGDDGPIIFDGRKDFAGGLTVETPLELPSQLNGLSLADLWEDSLHVDGDQTIDDLVVVDNDVSVVSIEANRTQFVLLDEVGKLSGVKRFDHLTIQGDWHADSIRVAGLVDGVDINSWSNDTLLKNVKNQVVTGRKSFKNLTVEDLHITDFEDGFNLTVFGDIVMKDRPDRIHGRLTIKGAFVALNASVKGLVDREENDLPLHWLRNGVDQSFSQGILVRSPLEVGSYYDSSWMINDVNISQLFERNIRTDQPVTLGTLHFDRIITDNINVGGRIQEVNVADELIRTFSPDTQTIRGRKSFTGPVQTDSLQVGNLINGMDPVLLCEDELESEPQTAHWTIEGNVIIKAGAKIEIGSIEKQPLDQLAERVWLKDQDVVLEHPQTFGDVIIHEIETDQLVNGVDLFDLADRTISLSAADHRPPITAVHRYLELEASRLQVGDFEGDSINDITRAQLTDSVLLRDTEQYIPNSIVFQDVSVKNVIVDGLVNEVDIGAQLMRTDQVNVVVGPKILDRLSVNTDVEVCRTCTVDGVDVSHWADAAVLSDGAGQTITAPVQFDSAVFADRLVVDGQLNGVTVDRHQLMTLDDDQIVSGRISLTAHPPTSDDITRHGDQYENSTQQFQLAARVQNMTVLGLYDGVNLTRFYDNAVHQNEEVTFTGPVTVSRLTIQEAQDLSVNSTIRDIISNSPSEGYHLAEPEATDLIKKEELDLLMEKVTKVASEQAVELQFFKEIDNQMLPEAGDVEQIYPMDWVDDRLVYCYSNRLGLFCGSSTIPLVDNINITTVTSSRDGALAVGLGHPEPAVIFFQSMNNTEVHRIALPHQPIDSVAVSVKNQSCFLVGGSDSISIFCPVSDRSSDSTLFYESVEQVSTQDIRQVSVCLQSNGSQLLAVRSENRDHGRIEVYSIDDESGRLQLMDTHVVSKTVSALDCICDEDRCYITTLSPSKPAVIPGEVVVWSLNNAAQATPTQRICLTEPDDVRFARLPDGRIALLILQRSGIHNVMVYVWQGQASFNHKTTVYAPGARNLHLVSTVTPEDLLIVLTVKPPRFNPTAADSIRLFKAHFLGLLHS